MFICGVIIVWGFKGFIKEGIYKGDEGRKNGRRAGNENSFLFSTFRGLLDNFYFRGLDPNWLKDTSSKIFIYLPSHFCNCETLVVKWSHGTNSPRIRSPLGVWGIFCTWGNWRPGTINSRPSSFP